MSCGDQSITEESMQEATYSSENLLYHQYPCLRLSPFTLSLSKGEPLSRSGFDKLRLRQAQPERVSLQCPYRYRLISLSGKWVSP
jgi:hypothetical protein